jgi:hypothetical protein
MYHAAAKNLQQQSQWKATLDNELASQDALLLRDPNTDQPTSYTGTFDKSYRWGAVWRFGVVGMFNFIDTTEGIAAAEQQWTQVMALIQGVGNAHSEAFAERWDAEPDGPRLNYQRVDL